MTRTTLQRLLIPGRWSLLVAVAAITSSLPTLAAAQGRISSETSARTFTVTAVGDIMMGTDFPEDRLRADRGQNLFKYTKEYFQASDIAFANLEGPLYDGPVTADSKGQGAHRYSFRTPTSYGHWLSEAGINVVSLANNHAMDFGSAGFESTKKTLEHEGIQYSSKKANQVATFQVRELKIALLAIDFYPGARSLVNPGSTYAEIAHLKQSFDVVIVSAHAGGEGASAERIRPGNENFLGEDRGDAIRFAHDAIDAGAGLILMHGPHVVRGLEMYKEHLIAYSLGNFTTESGIDVQSVQGLAPVLRVMIDENGRLVSGAITSFRQTRQYGTVYDPEGAAFKRMQKLSELDFPETMPQFDSESGRLKP